MTAAPEGTDTPHPFLPTWIVRAGAWSSRLLLLAAAVAVGIWLGTQVTLVLVALFVGFVLTAVLRPVALFFRRRMPAAVATILSLLVGLLAVAVLVTITVVGLTGSWGEVLEDVEEGLMALVAVLDDLGVETTILANGIEGLSDWVLDWVAAQGGALAGAAAAMFGTLAKVGMTLALGVFAAVAFLTSGERMWTWVLAQLPRSARPAWRTAGDIAWSRFKGYTLGSVLAAVIIGSLAFVVLVALGVPFAAPLAVLVFVGTFVPLIGAPAAMLVAMLVALAANGFWNAAFVGIAIALVGQVEGNLVQPLVLGKHVSLHPLVVALGVAAGTLVAGLLGAVVAVPLISITWAVYSALRTPPEPDDPQGPPPHPEPLPSHPEP